MKNYLKWASVFIISFLAMGCAATSEYVSPNPLVQQNANRIGHGKVVAVNIVDERNDSIIGRRPNDMGVGPEVQMLLASNSTDTLYQAVGNGLRARGFRPVNYADHPHTSTVLTISLTRLSFEYILSPYGNYYGSTLLNSTFKVSAAQAGMHYQQIYRVDYNAPIPAFANSKDRDQRVISKVLAKNINRMLFDKKLMGLLAR